MTYACRIEELPLTADVEFVAYDATPVLDSGLPRTPGAVESEDGRPVLLHVAPGRWFVPAPNDALRERLQGLATVGSVVEVEGKWAGVALSGDDAVALLGEAVDALAVLSGRGCAMVTLFDCPAILARTPADWIVWTRASHRPHLMAVLRSLGGG